MESESGLGPGVDFHVCVWTLINLEKNFKSVDSNF